VVSVASIKPTSEPNGNGSFSTRLRILTYHRVAELSARPRLNPRLISATPSVFARQIRHLVRNFHVVSAEEVLEAIRHSRTLPAHAVWITFDDAYRDFQDVAWPILKEHRAPVTLFVPTDYPDHPDLSFWWDRLYRAFAYTEKSAIRREGLGNLSLGTDSAREASLRRTQDTIKHLANDEAMGLVDSLCEELGVCEPPAPTVLGWEELRRLSREGVTVGAHTRSHPLLTKVSRERARDEIVGSQSDVTREIGRALPIFSYPNGDHDDSVVDLARSSGFEAALTQDIGHNDLESGDPLRLRRINVTRRSSLVVLQARLHPWFSVIERVRKGG
jgi:peptidoglycan/xylan/chitin deacetylase (PgdA/CDA1 family)